MALNGRPQDRSRQLTIVNGQTGNILKGSNLYLGQFIFLEKHRHDGQNCHVTSLQF